MHTNGNMTPSVLRGIEIGERNVGNDFGDDVLQHAYRDLEEQTLALQPTGDRPFVVSAFLKAKALAYTQGYIAAYRAGTEHEPLVTCSSCGTPVVTALQTYKGPVCSTACSYVLLTV